MAIVMSTPTFFPRRINMYVEAMQFADAVNSDGPTRIPFGSPLAAVSNNLINALALTASGTTPPADLTGNVNAQNLPAPWGQSIQFACSTTLLPSVIIDGGDYLGQAVRESLTLATVAVTQTKKCFKWIDRITFAATAAAPGTVSVGWGLDLGLPFRTVRGQFEVIDGVAINVTTNVTAGALNDPQTITSLDPRGKYRPSLAANGARVISLVADCVNDVNSSRRGGLHGIRHVNI